MVSTNLNTDVTSARVEINDFSRSSSERRCSAARQRRGHRHQLKIATDAFIQSTRQVSCPTVTVTALSEPSERIQFEDPRVRVEALGLIALSALQCRPIKTTSATGSSGSGSRSFADPTGSISRSKREIVVDHQRHVVGKPLLQVDVLAACFGRCFRNRQVVGNAAKKPAFEPEKWGGRRSEIRHVAVAHPAPVSDGTRPVVAARLARLTISELSLAANV